MGAPWPQLPSPAVYPDTGWVRAVVGAGLLLAPESNSFIFIFTPDDYRRFCSKPAIALQ